MSSDDISELASKLPAPAATELPAERASVLREHMLAEFRGVRATAGAAGRPRMRTAGWAPRRLALAGAGALAVAAAAGTFAAVAVTGVSPAGASPAAATLLAKIANAAQQQSSPRVRDSEFMYIRSDVAFATYSGANGQTITMARPHERQIWLPVANICVAGLIIENGARTPLNSGSSADGNSGGGHGPRCGTGSLNDPTYRLLQSLPTDPRTLLNLIYAGTSGEGQAQGPDGEAFTTIGDMIRETIVPPRTAAALYRAAALIPGVSLIGHVTNAEGRPGIAVAFTGNQVRYEWIFDPSTLQFIGERDYDMNAHMVTGDTAIQREAFVAKAGQFPGHGAPPE